MMHTHRHGKVVSTWRVRRNIAGRDQWSLLDKRDPLIAQHYYPIQDPSMTLVYGDQLAFRCTMVNLGEKKVLLVMIREADFGLQKYHDSRYFFREIIFTKFFVKMISRKNIYVYVREELAIVTIYCALCSRLPQSRNFHEICSYDAGKKKSHGYTDIL